MAWGKGGTKPGVSDWVQRLNNGDPSLTSIVVLRFRRFGSEEVKQLCEALTTNTTLRELYASGHPLTDDSIQQFVSLLTVNNTLASLCIGDDALGDKGVASLAEGLKSNRGLTKLDLFGKAFGQEGCAALSSALAHNSTLQHLVVSNNPLGDEGCAALFATSNCLQHIEASQCNIGPKGAEAIGSFLAASGAAVVQLFLGSNPLGPEGAAAIAVGLRQAMSLQELHLVDCAIGSSGATALADALSTNTSLVLLDVSQDGIGDEGAAALGAALRNSNTTLTTLFCRDNGITSQGVEQLAVALHSNSHLTQLDIGGSKVECSQLEALSAIPRLKVLSLFNTSLGDEGMGKLLELLECGKFACLKDVDVAGCGAGEGCLKDLLTGLKAGTATQLKVLDIGGNPGAAADSIIALLDELHEERPGLSVSRLLNAPGS